MLSALVNPDYFGTSLPTLICQSDLWGHEKETEVEVEAISLFLTRENLSTLGLAGSRKSSFGSLRRVLRNDQNASFLLLQMVWLPSSLPPSICSQMPTQFRTSPGKGRPHLPP